MGVAFSINQQMCNQQHKTCRHNGRLSQFYIGPNSAYDVPHFTNAHAVQTLSKLRNVIDHVSRPISVIPHFSFRRLLSAFRNSALYQHPEGNINQLY